MTIHRYAARRDTNEKQIVYTLRRLGAEVIFISHKGCGDLLVGWRGKNLIVECKTKKGKFTPDQLKFQQTWTGQQCTIRTVDEAIQLLNSITP